MNRFRNHLKYLYMEDLLYGALGGFLGALIAVTIGTASLYQVSFFTLVGMVASAFIISKQRMSKEDK